MSSGQKGEFWNPENGFCTGTPLFPVGVGEYSFEQYFKNQIISNKNYEKKLNFLKHESLLGINLDNPTEQNKKHSYSKGLFFSSDKQLLFTSVNLNVLTIICFTFNMN